MKLRTILGTIMTFALIVIIGVTNTKTVFAKKMIEVNVGSMHSSVKLAADYEAFNPDTGVLKSISATPNNNGVRVSYNDTDGWFFVEFKKLGTYKLKFKFANGKSEVATFKVTDMLREGKAVEFGFYKDGKGNDILYAVSSINDYVPNINIKFGKKTIIKNVDVNNGFIYVFKKGYLKKIKFNSRDIKLVRYEVVKGEYESTQVDINDKKIEDGIVTAIKLDKKVKDYEGYITIGDCENGDISNYSSGELYTIKLNKQESDKWIELEKGIPDGRLFVTNYLCKKIRKK